MSASLIISGVISLVLLFILILLAGFLVIIDRKRRDAKQKLNDLHKKQNARFAAALRQLDRIFRRRTGLSGDLLAAAANEIEVWDYSVKVDTYLDGLVDDVAQLFSEFTEFECAVSIKLIVQNPETQNLEILTTYRDRDSAAQRNDIYDEIEPFKKEDHTLIDNILSKSPFVEFAASNNLHDSALEYKNPNPRWSDLFSASAVCAIVGPESRASTNVYGFLCIDNNGGRLDSDMSKALMSIISTSIFYVLSAASRLEEIANERKP